MGMRTMSTTTTTLTPSVSPIEWISGTPALPGTSFTLRELRLEDAPLLLETLTMDELSAYIRTTPGHGCEPFNIWAHGAPATPASRSCLSARIPRSASSRCASTKTR